MDSINKIVFVNHLPQNIDTFYAIPGFEPLPYRDSIFKKYMEKSTDSVAFLQNASLNPNSSLVILLKDTNQKYIVTVTASHTEQIGKGRCAGKNTRIDMFKVNDVEMTGNTIFIHK